MDKISIELVPRDWEYLEEQFQLVNRAFPQINTLNIPDLLRFDIRSWEACIRGREYFKYVIPHLRAIDFDLREPFELAQHLYKRGITSVLVITGDKPQDMKRRVYRNTCLELIRVIKKEVPEMKIYAGIDQHRSSIREELDYIEAKREAGAEAFFTQPFFDIHLLNFYKDLLTGYEIFWGISPVLSEGSMNYWESKNNVVFPPSFSPTLEWNISFARDVFELLSKSTDNAYIMPIRCDVIDYLKKIFR